MPPQMPAWTPLRSVPRRLEPSSVPDLPYCWKLRFHTFLPFAALYHGTRPVDTRCDSPGSELERTHCRNSIVELLRGGLLTQKVDLASSLARNRIAGPATTQVLLPCDPPTELEGPDGNRTACAVVAVDCIIRRAA